MTLKTQTGQALTEFIIISPLFFLLLGGTLLLYSSIKRVYRDEFVKGNIELSDNLIPFEERNKGNWHSKRHSTRELTINSLDLSYNPSKAFEKSIDKKDGVFIDKKRVKNSPLSSNKCLDPTYHFSNNTEEKSILETCADASGYEKAQYLKKSFHHKNFLKQYHLTALFAPKNSFRWESRKLAAKNEVHLVSPNFLREFASLGSLNGKGEGEFVKNCLMSPFTDQCPLEQSLAETFANIAGQSSNRAIVKCFLEAVTRECAFDISGSCATLVAAEMTAHLALQKETSLCPKLNSFIHSNQIFVESLINARVTEINIIENSKLQELIVF
ncbi:MAG: hypothetical protein K2X39_04365 [Silvanigrellaceae bacterium]|nr:hypothetical protein [Silvanigrellaceae bacterium]